jgi:hypothetical protein
VRNIEYFSFSLFSWKFNQQVTHVANSANCSYRNAGEQADRQDSLFLDLPLVIMYQILDLLDPASLCACALVSY